MISGTLGLLGTNKLSTLRPEAGELAFIVSAILFGSGIFSLFESRRTGVLVTLTVIAMIAALTVCLFPFVVGK
jgi:uncharacterized membrane protein (UPF0136 family)